jgi:hypothetical protein
VGGVALRVSASCLASPGRGKRSRRHPWRLDRVASSNDRMRRGALSRSTPPTMKRPAEWRVSLEVGGVAPSGLRHPGSGLQGRLRASRRVHAPGPRSSLGTALRVRLPPPPYMREPPFREVLVSMEVGGVDPSGLRHPGSGLQGRLRSSRPIHGPRPRSSLGTLLRVRLPPPPYMREPPFREVLVSMEVGGVEPPSPNAYRERLQVYPSFRVVEEGAAGRRAFLPVSRC